MRPSEAAPSAIHGRANVGPDGFNLVHLQDAVPRRHVVLAADDRFDKAVALVGAHSPEIESRPAGKGLQLLAMTTCAAVVIEDVSFSTKVWAAAGVVIAKPSTSDNSEQANRPILLASTRMACHPSRRTSSWANCESESSRAPMTTMRSPRRANLTRASPQAPRSGKAKALRPRCSISQAISRLPTLRSTVPPK